MNLITNSYYDLKLLCILYFAFVCTYTISYVTLSNESNYALKSKRSKWDMWMIERVTRLSKIMHQNVEKLEIYLQDERKSGSKHKSNLINCVISRRMVCLTALAMLGSTTNIYILKLGLIRIHLILELIIDVSHACCM